MDEEHNYITWIAILEKGTHSGGVAYLLIYLWYFVNDNIHLPDKSRARGLPTGSWPLSAPVRISPRFLACRTAGNVGKTHFCHAPGKGCTEHTCIIIENDCVLVTNNSNFRVYKNETVC